MVKIEFYDMWTHDLCMDYCYRYISVVVYFMVPISSHAHFIAFTFSVCRIPPTKLVYLTLSISGKTHEARVDCLECLSWI